MSGGEEIEGRLIAGRYRLGPRIGAGGMGAVHRATDTRLAREVAVKVLPAEALGDEEARQRLLREARTSAALQHPGIVHVYDVGETDDGGAFLVMELVSGVSLRALVDDDSWAERERLTAIIDAARALGAAHRAGLIHRDVKPDNLMMRDDGRVALLDFGIAKAVGDGGGLTNLTGEGVVIGTPAYLSPEQARGNILDAHTDQFSLAVTAFELLTRKMPWSATSAIGVVAAIMDATPPPLRMADQALADAVGPVLARAMSKRPEDRYPDADAFASALAQAAGMAPTPSSRPMRSNAPPRPELAPTLAEASSAALAQTVVAPSEPVPIARRRRRWPIVAAVLAVAFATTLGIWRHRANPLDAPSPVVACPMLDAELDGKPAPWLGAAAAYALADDLAPMLGGFDDHVRGPARLLALPGYAPDAHDLDPWSHPGQREQTVAAASRAGLPWLDGRVVMHGTEVTLTVTLRAASGRELGAASATGSPLRVVTLEVSRKLRSLGALGGPHAVDPDFAAWQGVTTMEEQDAVADLEAATRGRTWAEFCRVSLPARLPDRWRAPIADGCAGKPRDAEKPPLALAREMAVSESATTPELRARFEREIAAAPAGQRKALAISATLRPEDANGILAAVAADPRAGWASIPEGMGTANLAFIASALVWAPDNPDWWLTATRASPSDRAGSSEFTRREFLLLPYGAVASLYADSLLREGNAGALGTVLAHLDGSPEEHDRQQGRLIAARASVLDGNFARTLLRWTDELKRPGALQGDSDDDNPRLSAARELAYATNGERALGDAVAGAIVAQAGKLAIADSNVTLRPNLEATCALAEPSLAGSCLAVLAPPESLPALQLEDGRRMQEVTAAYVARDFRRAAELLRGLMGSRYFPYYSVRFGDFVVDVFDRGGVPDLAEQLDLPHVDDRNLHGTSLATLRAARRARARGDKERARALAKRIVDSWSLVDMTVPAVAEMNALLAAP